MTTPTPIYRVGIQRPDGSWRYMLDPGSPYRVFETPFREEAEVRRQRCLEWQPPKGDGSMCRHQVVEAPEEPGV